MWKDVDGVLTCDPNIHPHAEPVPYLTFDEAAELAYFGAQVYIFEAVNVIELCKYWQIFLFFQLMVD